MLEQLLMHLKNWFLVPGGIHEDTYTIKDGSIALPFLENGQYFRIIGSVFNDGLYEYFDGNAICESGNEAVLTEETFEGAIWALAVPKSIISMAKEMEEWETKNGAAVSSPYQSESFGGYSYSKTAGKNGGAMTVWDAFASRLNAYKKTRELGYVKPSRMEPPQYYPPYGWR